MNADACRANRNNPWAVVNHLVSFLLHSFFLVNKIGFFREPLIDGILVKAPVAADLLARYSPCSGKHVERGLGNLQIRRKLLDIHDAAGFFFIGAPRLGIRDKKPPFYLR